MCCSLFHSSWISVSLVLKSPLTVLHALQRTYYTPDAAGHGEWVEQVQGHDGVRADPLVGAISCEGKGERGLLLVKAYQTMVHAQGMSILQVRCV